MLAPNMWTKASRSNGNGGNNCVEALHFNKAKKSCAAGHCVEVGFNSTDGIKDCAGKHSSGCPCDMPTMNGKKIHLEPGDVVVRDSKQNGQEDQPYIIFTSHEWTHYLHTLKMGYGAIFNGVDTYVIHKDIKMLTYTPAEWDAFMDGVWKGEFDLTDANV
jgi:hypothetical protein